MNSTLLEPTMCHKRKADIVLRDKPVPGETYEVTGGEPGAYASFRPRDSESPCWWDMTPIPAEEHSAVVKTIVEATSFEQRVSSRGTFRADLCGHTIRVQVHYTQLVRR